MRSSWIRIANVLIRDRRGRHEIHRRECPMQMGTEAGVMQLHSKLSRLWGTEPSGEGWADHVYISTSDFLPSAVGRNAFLLF